MFIEITHVSNDGHMELMVNNDHLSEWCMTVWSYDYGPMARTSLNIASAGLLCCLMMVDEVYFILWYVMIRQCLIINGKYVRKL